MCKPRIRETAQPQVPFEGATIRLDRRAVVARQAEHGERRQHAGAGRCTMNWWWLWLIWPLFGLGTRLAPVLADALALAAQVALPLLVPLALIAAGLLLLRR